MVDITEKDITVREAVACGTISMKPETFQMIHQMQIKKGDVLEVAKIAGIMAAKKTSELIPMSHPIQITAVDISFSPDKFKNSIGIEASVRVVSKTGAEMEALTAVSTSALTIYDMCKSIDREMMISNVRLLKKSGGKSGNYQHDVLKKETG